MTYLQILFTALPVNLPKMAKLGIPHHSPDNKPEEEDQKCPSPLDVDEGGVQILKVAWVSLLQIGIGHVTVAIPPDDVLTCPGTHKP